MTQPRFPSWLRASAFATTVAFAGCSSTTVFQTKPAGAQVWINGMPVGSSPVTMTDSKIVGTTNQVHIEAQGYEPLDVTVSRSEELDPGALIAGIFLLVPLLWVMRYQPVHYYELRPAGASAPNGITNRALYSPQGAPLTTVTPAPPAPPPVTAPTPPPAPAPPASPSGANRQARDAEARKECLAGRWQRGVEILADLYVETSDPVLLHNQARCFEQNGQYGQAASRFREYLRIARKTLSPSEISAIEASIKQDEKLDASRAR